MALSPQSTPSEGEIVESDSDKATTSLMKVNGTHVDRQSRKRISVSRSPTPIRSPIRYKSRTRSRSPYREPRGAKRLWEDDHHTDQTRDDPRRFKVRYENPTVGGQRNSRKYFDDIDRAERPDTKFRYDDQSGGGRLRDKRSRARSRSPFQLRATRAEQLRKPWDDRISLADGHSRSGRSRHGYRESSGKLSSQQSVSDRGQSPVATASVTHEAETRHNQTQHLNTSKSTSFQISNRYVV